MKKYSPFIIILLLFISYYSFRTKNGLIARYYVDKDIVTTKLDPRICFENFSRHINVVVDNYRLNKYPFPEEYPAQTIQWTGYIDIEETGGYKWLVETEDPLTIQVDNRTVYKTDVNKREEMFVPLNKGIHFLSITYSTEDDKGRFLWQWQRPDSKKWEFISIKNLYPTLSIYNSANLNRLIRYTSLLFILVITFLYRKQLLSAWPVIIFCIILLLAIWLRLYDYNLIPIFSDTMDEECRAWTGLSILRSGVPGGWSMIPEYGDWPIKRWMGYTFQMITPSFDHPQLYAIIIGISTFLGGMRQIFENPIWAIRLPNIIFSILTLILLYKLTIEISNNKRIALFTILLYAIIPTIVIGNRIAKEENLLTLLFLLDIWVYLMYYKSKKLSHLITLAILGGISFLVKSTGIIVICTNCIFLAMDRHWRRLFVLIPISLAISSLYFIYGAIIDWDMFLQIFRSQGRLISTLNIPVRLILEPKIIDTVFMDGGVLFLWVSILYISRLPKEKIRYIVIPLILYFLGISVSIRYDHVYGWYLIPLYPFLCIGGGIVINKIFEDIDILSWCIFGALILMSQLNLCVPYDLIKTNWLPKLVVTILFIIPLIFKNKMLSVIFIIFILLFIYTSIFIVTNFDSIYY